MKKFILVSSFAFLILIIIVLTIIILIGRINPQTATSDNIIVNSNNTQPTVLENINVTDHIYTQTSPTPTVAAGANISTSAGNVYVKGESGVFLQDFLSKLSRAQTLLSNQKQYTVYYSYSGNEETVINGTYQYNNGVVMKTHSEFVPDSPDQYISYEIRNGVGTDRITGKKLDQTLTNYYSTYHLIVPLQWTGISTVPTVIGMDKYTDSLGNVTYLLEFDLKTTASSDQSVFLYKYDSTGRPLDMISRDRTFETNEYFSYN